MAVFAALHVLPPWCLIVTTLTFAPMRIARPSIDMLMLMMAPGYPHVPALMRLCLRKKDASGGRVALLCLT